MLNFSNNVGGAMLYTATRFILNLSRMKTSQSKAGFERIQGGGEKNMENPKIVDEWHTCHM